jgi:hypothetical protein
MKDDMVTYRVRNADGCIVADGLTLLEARRMCWRLAGDLVGISSTGALLILGEWSDPPVSLRGGAMPHSACGHPPTEVWPTWELEVLNR